MTLSFKMKFDTKGIKDLQQLEKKLQPVVAKHALAIQAEAAKNAPVDTGALKNSIIAEKSEKTDSNWVISDGVEYGVYQELGHGIGVQYDSGGGVVFASSFAGAKHFLGNACEKQADKFFDDVKKVIDESGNK